jgi:chorismate synthase
MLGINAVKGFEYGMGFNGATKRGSQVNDLFINNNQSIETETNFSGGIQGGIANGQDIVFRVAFKPVPTILKTQSTVDVDGKPTSFTPQGRHDPCVLPRAVPIVEAMAAMVVLDHFLINNAYHFNMD